MMEGKLNYIPIISCDRMLLSGGRIMEKISAGDKQR